MKGTERQSHILKTLKAASGPIVARKLADEFGVSRQVIVGDIALLRAAGEEILSTPSGYLMNIQPQTEVKKRYVFKHTTEDTADEIRTVIELGGKMLDVTVDHPVYGEITGLLNIFTSTDAEQFIEKVTSGEASLLSELTDGIHVHTLSAESAEQLDLIEAKLEEKGYLYTK